MSTIIYILIIVVDVLVIMDVLKTKKDNEKKVIWIVAVVLLPILGPILYYFLGRK
jgi:hypothetical protein